jgi:hypothetical protein
MKRVISMRWLANPNRGHSHFSHEIWSSREYLIHYQSEDSHLLIGQIGLLNYVDY